MYEYICRSCFRGGSTKATFWQISNAFVLILLLYSFIFSQSNPPKPEFLFDGETLVYEVKYNYGILRGIDVGTLTFSVSKSEGVYNIRFEGRSKGTFVRLFGQRILQIFQSSVDAEKFRILKTIKRDEQGNRIRDSEAVFDYKEKKVVFVETDPNDPLKPPRKIASTIEEETHDLVSGIYRLRQSNLEIGKVIETTVSDSGLVYKIPVKVTGKEKRKTLLGNVWCFLVEPQVFGQGRLIEREGRMIIWIADNERRIPVLSRVYTNIGRLEVKLKQIQNSRN